MMMKYPFAMAVFSMPFRMEAKKWVTMSGTITPIVRGAFSASLVRTGWDDSSFLLLVFGLLRKAQG